MRRKYIVIENYQQLYDYVKEIKDNYNYHMDTAELVDTLIFKWFSKGGVKALDTCYEEFNKRLKSGLKLKMEEGEIKPVTED